MGEQHVLYSAVVLIELFCIYVLALVLYIF